jgi:membrane protein
MEPELSRQQPPSKRMQRRPAQQVIYAQNSEPKRTIMFQRAWCVLRESFSIFMAKESFRRGAAIAFYTVTSIAPVLLIVIAVAGLVFGSSAARGALFEEFRGLLGADGADFLQKAIASSAASPTAGVAATVISVIGLILTASGIFSELEDALNAIWEVKLEGGFFDMARARMASLGLVVALGFLLMVSLVVDAGLKAFSGIIDAKLPLGAALLMLVSFALSFALIAVLFAAIYKLLPAKALTWREVMLGAVVSALLFEIGKFLIGLYLGSSSAVSSLGAAGALLGLLFWVYYSAQIFLFGAALTKAYSHAGETSG